MFDFLMISTRSTKRGVIEIYPKFIIKKSSDLMIRGGDFYAIWDEAKGLWSTDEHDAINLIDYELDKYAEENRQKFDSNIKVLHMWDAESGVIDSWHKYCQKQMRDRFKSLDENIIFSNSETNKKDYASKRLNYPLEKGSIKAYDKLMSTIYTKEEREKIEWAIGSIVSGDSKKIQKFMVLYGSAGTGKSTILNIIQSLFEGYYSVFDAKALGSSSNSFALESFKNNPLVAIQHDGDLSKIEDNTRLNSLVSHEMMSVNEKFKSTYANTFKCFLFMGTNKPVKITDAKSGLIRRLIDVSPSGNKVEHNEYKKLMTQIDFELGAIAYYCKEFYLKEPNRYDDYIPVTMLGASNDFYNFIIDSYHVFKKEDGVTLKSAWEMYKIYCDEAKVPYPFSQRIFKEELRNYFHEYKDRFNLEDGTRARSYYKGFRTDKFEINDDVKPTKTVAPLSMTKTKSLFDDLYFDSFAQYATKNETPILGWDSVKTKLKDIDTSRLHYVRVPENHIVIDFDMKDENGNKSLGRNLEAAEKWPPTYAEFSKSGAGVHLHYIYTGDVSRLSRIYDDEIEVKVFSGKSSLRRLLSVCNDLPIATISSGLPLKGDDKVVNINTLKSERGLRTLIIRNLNKEIHASTVSSIDFINKILNDAYDNNLIYDISDMHSSILSFAASSTNKSDYCIKLVSKMKFKSDINDSEGYDESSGKLVFYDVEVFPNLFIVCWKLEGADKKVIRMINPSASEIEELIKFKLVGFNCRRYDNHILYGRLIGYTNEQLYRLSQDIISGKRNCFFGEAYNISYTDVYDFSSKKQSLKKFEIELGVHHQELGLPWDEPVPEDMWVKVSEYCDNDVYATEATFNARKGDFTARQILADLAGGSVNDTTNTLTTKIIFGNNRKPQDQFIYRDLAQPVHELSRGVLEFLEESKPKMMSRKHGEDKSLLPYFPGYTFGFGKSTYKGVEVGEGGRVYGEPGIHTNVALLDVASMHPNSGITEVIFGVEFTRRFKEIVDGRVGIKHEAWELVDGMLDGKLTPYIQKVLNGEMTSGELATALKIAINSVYGLTSARFDNAFRDPRNKDNLIAKRGALFMVDLQLAVQALGFEVAHIKTDSIKIPNADNQMVQFVINFGLDYGYEFEHEATYEKMCLVNDTVYVSKYASKEYCEKTYGYIPKDNKKYANTWTATGTQFQVPYVFKKIFSKEKILFEDMCETKAVTTALYLDMNEDLPDVSEQEKTVAFAVKKAKESGITIDINKPTGDGELDPLLEEIAKGHDYRFVGKVGQFCPIKEGHGGGLLMREKDGKYNAASGTKGFRWLESERVKQMGKEKSIDHNYYIKLVDDAINSISKFGDVEWFIS